MATIAQIRAALKTVLGTIAPGAGYVNTLAPSHIYDTFNNPAMSQKKDADYPKCVVVTDDGKARLLASFRQERTISFMLVLIVKKLAPSDDPAAMIDSFIEDVNKAINQSHTLGGTVDSAEMTEFLTDSGHAYPEGVAVILIETKSQRTVQ